MDGKTLQDIVDITVERTRGGAPVSATVSEGVVTLTGAVQNEMRRIVIEQELRRIPDVLDVHNHLHVAEPAGDAGTRLHALLAREDVAAPGIDIDEADGIVTLSGRAPDWFSRDAAERLAWMLPGVRQVVNRLRLPFGAVEPPNGEGDAPPDRL